jgi:hypothetical protein
MQATFPIRRLSIQPVLIALAVAAALIFSAAGGYWLRSMTSQGATVVTVAKAAVQTSVPPVRSDRVRDLELAGAAQSQSSATGSSQGLFGRASDAIPAQQVGTRHKGQQD